MNENIDLREILKNCPKGTKLYSPIFGDVFMSDVKEEYEYPIIVETCLNEERHPNSFDSKGFFFIDYDGECMLFPSKDQRDWSKFKVNKPKFDPKTLQPFDKVLARIGDGDDFVWYADFVSHRYDKNNVPEVMSSDKTEFNVSMVIPYNEETKHLVGTSDEAPEYYRYWED